MGKIKSLSITDCDVTGPAVDANINFHNINENGDKALDFDLDLPYDADGSEYTVRTLYVNHTVAIYDTSSSN